MSRPTIWRMMPGASIDTALAGEDALAIAQDSDAIGEAFQFFHAVRDVDDGKTFGFQFGDDAEEFLAFLLRKHGGWLIHHDDARRGGECACDLDELLFGASEATDARIRRDVKIVALKNFLRLRM